jgi:hypothetical protein
VITGTTRRRTQRENPFSRVGIVGETATRDRVASTAGSSPEKALLMKKKQKSFVRMGIQSQTIDT